LSADPLADIWITIHQRNISRFALSQKIDAALTCESHILKVERNTAALPFRSDECIQAGHMFFIDSTAQGEDHFAAFVPLDSKQSHPQLFDRNGESNPAAIAGH
jgi:hypothetical protein